MTSDAQAILQSWSAPVGVNLALGLTVIIHVRGWLRLHATFPIPFSFWRLVAFLTVILSVWIAIGSVLAAFDDLSVTLHMVQRLLLMAIAPTLPSLHRISGQPLDPSKLEVI
jgi:cytochrome c oxidase assembly factor CtaG